MMTQQISGRRLRVLSLVLALSLLANLLTGSAAQADTHRKLDAATIAAFFDEVLPAQLAREHVAGAMAAVVYNGETVFAKGYGYADVAAGVHVTPERTLFFIGSDGKLLTWTAVMQLVEQGRLDLHANINAYLDFAIPEAFDKPITLHHLMTHTAGFEDQANSLFVAGREQLLPLRQHLVRFMPARVYPPGAVMAYSNYGTALAGYIVERVAGQPFEDYLTEHLLQPLGMQHSFAGAFPPPALIADLAKGYRYRDGAFVASDFEWTAAVPAAPIRTTASDISRFMLAHLNRGCIDGACILRPASVADMHATHFTHHPHMSGMAYGFMEMTINGEHVLWHLGGSAHFVTMLALIPAQQLGIVVSYNTPPADDGRAILFQFMGEFFPTERAAAKQAPASDGATRAAVFNGAYAPARTNHTTAQKLIRYTMTAPVTIENERLTFNGWEFVETAPNRFQQVDGDRTLVFQIDEHGVRWLFVGVLAYFQAPWSETPLWLLTMVAANVLLALSLAGAWLLRRRRRATPDGRVIALAIGLSIFTIALFVWLAVELLQFADTLIYPQTTVTMIAQLYWVAAPWTLAVVVVVANAWLRRRWSAGWRVHYSLFAVAALGWLALLWRNHLLGGG